MTQQELFDNQSASNSPSHSPSHSKNGFADWPDQAEGWNRALSHLFDQDWWQSLAQFVEQQRSEHAVYPAAADVFRAFALTDLDDVRFVVLGQDPYHGQGQAHGLSFSVTPGTRHPPSLANIFKELHSDLGVDVPQSGDLTNWAKQGGLLLNTVLTVRAAEANSHRKQGWEKFTDAVIETVSAECENVAFVLWGTPARKKVKLIDANKHLIVESVHPSPLSSYRGFFGSKPFSKINEYRRSLGLEEVDWSLQGQ